MIPHVTYHKNVRNLKIKQKSCQCSAIFVGTGLNCNWESNYGKKKTFERLWEASIKAF